MKTYSGFYKIKNPKKYIGDPDNIVYRSHWEKCAFRWLDENVDIVRWASEEIVVPYYSDVDKRDRRYFPDLYYETVNNEKFLIEIKPHKETAPPKSQRKTKRYIEEGLTYIRNQNKWAAAQEFCKKNNITFATWTEHELRAMGILKKAPGAKLNKVPGKLKKAPTYKKKKKIPANVPYPKFTGKKNK